MQQNATAVGALPRTPLEELTLQRSPDPIWGAVGYAAGGPWPTQNFGWVGHNALGPRNWHVYSLILFANSLKLVLPDVRFSG